MCFQDTENTMQITRKTRQRPVKKNRIPYLNNTKLHHNANSDFEFSNSM